MYNIYCDESCHLQYDDSDIMLMGGICCEKQYVKKLSNKIRAIKKQFGISENFEVKWTKVSPSKRDFYIALVDCFFDSPIQFRCVIATGKKKLNHQAFNQTYDDWYYKMYYLLLNKMIDPTEEYAVYIDIKDTNGGKKARKLQEILNRSLYGFYNTCIQKIQIVKSNEIELLQLCDLLMGCIGFYNRYGDLFDDSNVDLSIAKKEMCQHLRSKLNRPLNQKTPLSEAKFNIFVWEPRG